MPAVRGECARTRRAWQRHHLCLGADGVALGTLQATPQGAPAAQGWRVAVAVVRSAVPASKGETNGPLPSQIVALGILTGSLSAPNQSHYCGCFLKSIITIASHVF